MTKKQKAIELFDERRYQSAMRWNELYLAMKYGRKDFYKKIIIKYAKQEE